MDEVKEVSGVVSDRKMPGNDGIAPDLIKHCKTNLLQNHYLIQEHEREEIL